MVLDCKHCSALVNAVEIAVYEEPGNNEIFDPPGRWTFVHCPACKLPMLTVQVDDGEGFEEDAPSRVYPPRDRQLSYKTPKTIKEAFDEAVICFRAKAFTASSIMCRKSLEGLCAEHGARASNLSKSLKILKDKGVIENRLFEWAEALRALGNEAAHGVGVLISREDANDTLDFTEALIQYVFTYQDQFQKFLKRRGPVPSQDVE